MRNLIDVRKAILNVIEDQRVKEDLEKATEDIARSYIYSSPEYAYNYWQALSTEVEHKFTALTLHSRERYYPEETTWGKTAIGILNDTLDYQEYLVGVE